MFEVLEDFELDPRPRLGTVIDALTELADHHGRDIPFHIDGIGETSAINDVRVVNRNGEKEMYMVIIPEHILKAINEKI